jgi:hypothetical protein
MRSYKACTARDKYFAHKLIMNMQKQKDTQKCFPCKLLSHLIKKLAMLMCNNGTFEHFWPDKPEWMVFKINEMRSTSQHTYKFRLEISCQMNKPT